MVIRLVFREFEGVTFSANEASNSRKNSRLQIRRIWRRDFFRDFIDLTKKNRQIVTE